MSVFTDSFLIDINEMCVVKVSLIDLTQVGAFPELHLMSGNLDQIEKKSPYKISVKGLFITEGLPMNFACIWLVSCYL